METARYQHRARSIWLLAGGALGVALCMGCQSTPQGIEALAAWSGEYAAVDAQAALVLEGQFGGLRHDPLADQRLGRIGRRLVRVIADLPCGPAFYLLKSDDLNAFSLPGGTVYLTTGLYDRLGSDALLAAALAHELAHISARDGLRPRGSAEAVLEKELAADKLAVRYLMAAGFQPQALLELLGVVRDRQPPAWAEKRIAALAGLLEPATPPQPVARPRQGSGKFHR